MSKFYKILFRLKRGLMRGVMYFCGRDKSMRPLMVVAAKRAPQSWYKKPEFFIKLLIFHMEYLSRYFLVPGVVETLNVLIDLRGIDIWTFPISQLSQVYKVLSNHYLGRVQHFYILNAPRFLGAVMRLITKMLTDRQQQKYAFLFFCKFVFILLTTFTLFVQIRCHDHEFYC